MLSDCNQIMATDTPFSHLATEDDWTKAREASQHRPVLIFKHSSACPISADANDEMATLADTTDVPVYRVVVQEHRAISDMIEDALQVKHETPQAIVMRDGDAVFDTSHFNVTVDTLRENLRRVPTE